MGDLDRLLELACFNGKLMSLEHRDEYDSLKKEIQELIEKGEKYDKLMTHSKYHNTFGCQYHFDLKESKKEINDLKRKDYHLEQQNKLMLKLFMVDSFEELMDVSA